MGFFICRNNGFDFTIFFIFFAGNFVGSFYTKKNSKFLVIFKNKIMFVPIISSDVVSYDGLELLIIGRLF